MAQLSHLKMSSGETMQEYIIRGQELATRVRLSFGGEPVGLVAEHDGAERPAGFTQAVHRPGELGAVQGLRAAAESTGDFLHRQL